jgi:Gas vesicle protein
LVTWKWQVDTVASGSGVGLASVTSICISCAIDRRLRSWGAAARDGGAMKTTGAKAISYGRIAFLANEIEISTFLLTSFDTHSMRLMRRLQLSRSAQYTLNCLGMLYFRELYFGGSRELRAGHHARNRANERPAHHTVCMPTDLTGTPTRGNAGLVDILDRVLDKGLVVAGDIKVSLAEVELLTIRIRLMICSIDKAEEIGLDWWKYDRHLSPGREQVLRENLELREQLRLLERRVASLTRASSRRGRATGKALTSD